MTFPSWIEKRVGERAPRGLADCEECGGGGWMEPLDIPNDLVLATIDVEPCDCRPEIEEWYSANRSLIAGLVI